MNGARVYITQDILNLNYVAWLGLLWNGFHAIKWALVDRDLKLWGEIERKGIEALELETRRATGEARRLVQDRTVLSYWIWRPGS